MWSNHAVATNNHIEIELCDYVCYLHFVYHQTFLLEMLCVLLYRAPSIVLISNSLSCTDLARPGIRAVTNGEMLTFELCILHPITRPDGQNNNIFNITQYKHAIKVILWLNFVFFSEIITFIQTPEEHWLLRVPDLSAIYSHCDAVLGVILDQPRSHQCQSGSRSVIALYCSVWLCCVLCAVCSTPSLLSWVLQVCFSGQAPVVTRSVWPELTLLTQKCSCVTMF